MIVVDLALAIICFAGTCHNALIGKDTPKGEYSMMHVYTEDPGYGGDVLVFADSPKKWYALHRVWLLKPKQQRLKRLASDNPKDRVITAGCINVLPEVYQQIVDCCSDQKILIK